MTQAAQIAKPNSRQAAIGENYVCPRCKGEGGSKGWVVQFGTCFKCNGAGVVRKVDPNATYETVIYMVKDEKTGIVHQMNCNDKHYKDAKPDTTKWLGDKISFKWYSSNEWKEMVIVGKSMRISDAKGRTISEKKSKGFDDIKFY